MCYFLTIGVQADGAVLIDGDRGGQHRGRRLTFAPLSNPSLATIFPRGDRLFWVTSGMCSCDLYLRRNVRKHSDLGRERNKYRAKGWSESKIGRALRAKLAERRTVARGQREDTPRELLHDLLLDLSACHGGVRVFAHMYQGEPNEENLPNHARTAISLSELIDGGNFPEDTVVDVIGQSDSRSTEG
jgi:hypothetical protein